MENHNVITYTDYNKYKMELDTELQQSAESFVKIGYLLKVARDTNILRDSQYENVNEFAQKEYGLDKTQVSRFININDKFSEDGYSERLKESYRGFGYAKLSIMLLLPDEVNSMLSPAYSKAEIQELKKEVEEEKKVSDIEVMLEPQTEMQQGMESNLVKVVNQLGKDTPELYIILHKTYAAGGNINHLKEVLAPAGEKIYSIRVAGVGRMMLSIKETEDRVLLTNIRTGKIEEYTWEIMQNALGYNMNLEKDSEESWEERYGEKFPQKTEVAPVQLENKKAVSRKESKISKAKVELAKPEKKENEEQQPVEQVKESESHMQQAEEQKQASDEAVEQYEEGHNVTDAISEEKEKPEKLMKEKTEEGQQEYNRIAVDMVIKLHGLIFNRIYKEAKSVCNELLDYLKEIEEEG